MNKPYTDLYHFLDNMQEIVLNRVIPLSFGHPPLIRGDKEGIRQFKIVPLIAFLLENGIKYNY